MVVAVVALTAAPSEAGTSTFQATTTIGPTVLPHAAVVGEGWKVDGSKASLTFTVVNPAPAVTRVVADWVSPYAHPNSGLCIGNYKSYYRNNGFGIPTPHIVQRVRYHEEGKRWSRWIVIFDEDYLEAPFDMAIGSGMTTNCLVQLPRATRRRVQVEIHHAVTYRGDNWIDETLKLSVP
jgi:hypothetical protein